MNEGVVYLTVVYAQAYTKRDGTLGTKLYVPVGSDCMPVFVSGDQTARAGVCTAFMLKSFQGQLRLGLAEEL